LLCHWLLIAAITFCICAPPHLSGRSCYYSRLWYLSTFVFWMHYYAQLRALASTCLWTHSVCSFSMT
jgi:hypothetical protein